ncbi:MAG: DegV family protein [Anaerolineae bacterium]|nr:DegV family protein [Anaerolineae bacterium]
MDKLTPVAIVTDSAAGIPSTLLEQYRIAVIPFWVTLDGISHRDGIDMHPPEFFARLRKQTTPDANTGVPAISVFQEAYRRVSEWAKGIVSIHVAGKQSGTCNTAKLAATESAIPTVVVDTGTTAMGQGFVVLEAARAAAKGAGLDEVVQVALDVASKVGVIALLESIDYAIKGGRLSSAARMVGGLLRIQPLVRVQDNRLSIVGQARRRSKGLQALIEKIVMEAEAAPTHLVVHYAENAAEGQALLDTLKARLNCVETYLTWIPVALGVHAGPGSLGVAYYVEKEMVDLGLLDRLDKLAEYAKEAVNEAKSRLSNPFDK